MEKKRRTTDGSDEKGSEVVKVKLHETDGVDSVELWDLSELKAELR